MYNPHFEGTRILENTMFWVEFECLIILEEVNESKLRYKLFESVAIVMIQTFQVETSDFEVEQRYKGSWQTSEVLL